MSFAHTGQAQPYSNTDLALLSRFPMVQFDKKQSIATMPHLDTEDRLILAAKQVKGANPKVHTLMYINGLINFKAQRLYNATQADPSLLLVNTAGQHPTLTPGKDTVFDMRQPAMRKLFVEVSDSRHAPPLPLPLPLLPSNTNSSPPLSSFRRAGRSLRHGVGGLQRRLRRPGELGRGVLGGPRRLGP
jgi:hypothetical protein